jgi:mono/diheme cytochrome c family protein
MMLGIFSGNSEEKRVVPTLATLVRPVHQMRSLRTGLRSGGLPVTDCPQIRGEPVFQSCRSGEARSASRSVLPWALTLFCSLGSLLPAQEVSAAEHPGAVIYRRMCADCHGAKGQGVEGKHDDPLAGTRSVAALARIIAKTMPEGKEGTCVGVDADAVAAYIYEAFYSPAAQARIRPVQETLSRLTVAQYKNSVADLVGRFTPGFDTAPKADRGLRVLFTGFAIPTPEEIEEKKAAEKDPAKRKELQKKPRRTEKVERVDPVVSVHFGAESPNPAAMIQEEFQGRWFGSLLAPDTGVYEFVLKSENGVRLYLNTNKDPVIDAWVSTGPEVREERKSIFLLGGRSYRVLIEMLKYKDKSASLEFWWKRPHGVLEIVPQSSLMPQEVRPSVIVSTAIPADDRSDGYERGTSLSKEWDQAITAAALEVASAVEADLDNLAGTKAGAPDRLDRFKVFAKRFAETAFRRPLSAEESAWIVDRNFEKAPNPNTAVKRVVLFALKSAAFLYPEVARKESPEDFINASRLALALWDSIPDAALWKAASEGRLRTEDQVRKEAQRMIADGRTKAKLRGFFEVWLDLERAENAVKDGKEFPEFDESLRADLRQSLFMFLDEVVWSDASDYRRLLLGDHVWLNGRLGKVYGGKIESGGFEKVVPDHGQSAGVITHPYLLSAFAYNRTTSPIHRGVFLSRSIVGVQLKNPSVAVAFEDAKFDPHLTMREKVSSLTKNASCAGCHGVINPLGFTLEHFDAVGRFRTEDNRRPVDAAVDFETDDGAKLHFEGPRDVARHAAESAQAHRAFVRELFHYAIKQPPGAFGADALDQLTKGFEAESFHIRNLFAEIAVKKALSGKGDPVQKVATLPPESTDAVTASQDGGAGQSF